MNRAGATEMGHTERQQKGTETRGSKGRENSGSREEEDKRGVCENVALILYLSSELLCVNFHFICDQNIKHIVVKV